MKVSRVEKLDFKMIIKDGCLRFYITDYVFKELATVREVSADRYSTDIVRYNKLVNGDIIKMEARG